MNISRKQLYALGEPLGDSVTRLEGRRVICGGGGGGSKSSSNATTTTTNTDKRQVINSGAVGVTADTGSTINVTNQNLDAGIVTKALDTVSANDATNGAGFTQLLALADKMFTGAGDIIGKAQETTLSQVAALNTAANDQKGQVDQKTLIILAVAGVGLLAMRKK